MMKHTKKLIALMCVVTLLFSSMYTNTLEISAASGFRRFTTANKAVTVDVRSLNDPQVKADSTSLMVKSKSAKKMVVIDFGDAKYEQGTHKDQYSNKTLENLKGTLAYNSKTKTLNIDYFVLTHAHVDHVVALNKMLSEITNNKLKVNIGTLYLNAVYFTGGNTYDLKGKLKQLMNKSNFNVKNIWVMGEYSTSATLNGKVFNEKVLNGYRSATNVNKKNMFQFLDLVKTTQGKKATWHYSTTIRKVNVLDKVYLVVMPPLKKFNIKNKDDGNVNNSGLFATVKDKTDPKGAFKIDFMADLQDAGTTELIRKSSGKYVYNDHLNELSKNTFSSLYYKVSHHGVRSSAKGYGSNGNNKESDEATLLKQLSPTVVIGTAWTVGSRKASYTNYSTFIKNYFSNISILTSFNK